MRRLVFLDRTYINRDDFTLLNAIDMGSFGDRIALNGHPTERLPNTLNVSFIGRAGSEILARVENVAASTGSACHSGSVELSPVLKAMKVPPQIGMGAIRFSLGRTTTREEIEQVVSRM